jgi:hypothetical protein
MRLLSASHERPAGAMIAIMGPLLCGLPALIVKLVCRALVTGIPDFAMNQQTSARLQV